jgi:hypothetical protein
MIRKIIRILLLAAVFLGLWSWHRRGDMRGSDHYGLPYAAGWGQPTMRAWLHILPINGNVEASGIASGVAFFVVPYVSDPATCTAGTGQIEFNTTSNQLKICTGPDTWTPLATGGSSVPGGPATSVQYNAGSSTFGGSANLEWSGTALVITGGLSASGTITLSGISGSTQCLQVNSSGVVSGAGAACGSGSVAFSSITSGTNTTATMNVGAGAALGYTSTGVVNSNEMLGGLIFNQGGSNALPSSHAEFGYNASNPTFFGPTRVPGDDFTGPYLGAISTHLSEIWQACLNSASTLNAYCDMSSSQFALAMTGDAQVKIPAGVLTKVPYITPTNTGSNQYKWTITPASFTAGNCSAILVEGYQSSGTAYIANSGIVGVNMYASPVIESGNKGCATISIDPALTGDTVSGFKLDGVALEGPFGGMAVDFRNLTRMRWGEVELLSDTGGNVIQLYGDNATFWPPWNGAAIPSANLAQSTGGTFADGTYYFALSKLTSNVSQTISAITVTAGTAVVTCSVACGSGSSLPYAVNGVIEITGSSVSACNAYWALTAVTSSTVSFSAGSCTTATGGTLVQIGETWATVPASFAVSGGGGTASVQITTPLQREKEYGFYVYEGTSSSNPTRCSLTPVTTFNAATTVSGACSGGAALPASMVSSAGALTANTQPPHLAYSFGQDETTNLFTRLDLASNGSGAPYADYGIVLRSFHSNAEKIQLINTNYAGNSGFSPVIVGFFGDHSYPELNEIGEIVVSTSSSPTNSPIQFGAYENFRVHQYYGEIPQTVAVPLVLNASKSAGPTGCFIDWVHLSNTTASSFYGVIDPNNAEEPCAFGDSNQLTYQRRTGLGSSNTNLITNGGLGGLSSSAAAATQPGYTANYGGTLGANSLLATVAAASGPTFPTGLSQPSYVLKVGDGAGTSNEGVVSLFPFPVDSNHMYIFSGLVAVDNTGTAVKPGFIFYNSSGTPITTGSGSGFKGTIPGTNALSNESLNYVSAAGCWLPSNSYTPTATGAFQQVTFEARFPSAAATAALCVMGTTNVSTAYFYLSNLWVSPAGASMDIQMPINLALGGNGGVTGNLPVTNLNGGTGANSTTAWFGDGTWKTPSGSGTVNGASQYSLTYYSGSGTSTSVSGVAAPTTNGYWVCGYNVTASVALAPSCALTGITPNPQTGTTYTYLYSDRGAYTTFSNASAIAVTLPQAGGTGFASNWYNLSCNIGAGTATITPSTSTISYTNGNTYTSAAGSLALTTGQCVFIYSDGTNYFGLLRGAGGIVTFDSTSTGLAQPLGNGTFTYPVSTSNHLSLTGTTPASASSGVNPGQILNVQGENGGACTGASCTGGQGSSITLTGGNGGTASGTSGNPGTGGPGGAVSFLAGSGNAGTANNSNGGAAGQIFVETGTAGAANGSGTGGVGGNFTFLSSTGGATNTGTAGNGGGFTFTAGSGGAAASGNGTGGNGGSFALAAGNGGTSRGSSNNSNGGNITLSPGSAGIDGGGTAGTPGSVIIGNITGSTQCVQANSGGSLSGTGAPCGASTISLSSITAAVAANTIANGNNSGQVWNWALTANSETAFAFGETTAATNGTLGNQYILKISTMAGSTAVPVNISDSLSGSQTLPTLHITPTWNTTGVVDAAILVNVTNTASGTGSLLLDLQIGGTSEAKVDKSGNFTALGTGSFGSSPPACTAGTGGGLCLTEGSGLTNVSGTAGLYADSTSHELLAATNGSTSFGMLVRRQPGAIRSTGLTASVSTATLCAASAGACNIAGSYIVRVALYQSGTACTANTTNGVSVQLTWTDANGTSHSAQTLPLISNASLTAFATSGVMAWGATTLGAWASGDILIDTNGTVIQYATTYANCTTGTATYALSAVALRAQ